METIDRLIILIPVLPLVAALVTPVLGPRILKGASHWPAMLAILIAFLADVSLGPALMVLCSRTQHA